MTSTPYIRGEARRETIVILLAATLLTSAVHFVDNAFRLDLYPGPAWLTRNGVLLAWLVLPVLAWMAYRSGMRTALAAYGVLGFAGLAHFLVPHPHAIPLRCAVTILGEAISSAVLIAYVLSHAPFRAHRQRIAFPPN